MKYNGRKVPYVQLFEFEYEYLLLITFSNIYYVLI